MIETLGQNKDVWTKEWQSLSPESEIQMWDYYGGRQWISKYVPRHGKTIEAGCGLGRYNFYFSKLGIDIEGIDFSSDTIAFLKKWSEENNFSTNFVLGDITKMPYPDSSINGYISLGVIEHFVEGPQKPLLEAFRVMKPGGVAIITTPNISFYLLYKRLVRKAKSAARKLLRMPVGSSPFFQYEYRPYQLRRFLENTGFYVSRATGADLLYPFNEIGNFSGSNLQKKSFSYWFSDFFENTIIRSFGAQSITVSVKTADIMHCFFCDKLSAEIGSLKVFDVPVCSSCGTRDISLLYIKGRKVSYSASYLINPPVTKSESQKCKFCNTEFVTDPISEKFGFIDNACPTCLKMPEVNIKLCVSNIQPVWRKRKPVGNKKPSGN